MGFEDFVSEMTPDGSSSSSSGSSSSGGRTLSRKRVPKNADESQYPFFYEETPQHAIVRTEHGLKYKTWPDTPSVKFAKFTPDGDWEKEDDSHLKRVWWSDLEFNRVKEIVKSELNANLVSLLKSDPERADEAITRALNRYGWSDQEFSNERDCGVCDESINLTYGEYENVGTTIVCSSHSVKELSNAGVI